MNDSPNEFPELMDTHQVAQYLRIKERKVYELLKEGRIPSARVTGKWLFPKSRIDAWLKENSDDTGGGGRPRRGRMVMAGSHDPLLEWCLHRIDPGLAVLPGDSMDGLVRLATGEAAIAGVHLLDEDSGDYNVPFVRRDLGHADVVVIEWARRAQGLVVAPGNPKGLRTLADVVRQGASVILRQTGSGSHILFEWLLRQSGLTVDSLNIVPSIARNENDIALAVSEGRADVGLAVATVAQGLRLNFVPLHQERFDLVVERWAYFEPAFQSLLALTRASDFRDRADGFGGYDIKGLGTIHYNAP
jgi:excisionase family DNA binding protein